MSLTVATNHGDCPWARAQSDDAITNCHHHSFHRYSKRPLSFSNDCRDGSYSIFSLSTSLRPEVSRRKVSLSLVHQASPPLGPMIEAAWFSDSGLMLYGFRSKSFIVWNETKQCEISSIECGGGHRSYAYIPSTDGGGAGHFAYTKASRLYMHSQPIHHIEY